MSRHFIPVEEVTREWMQDPEFKVAYDALEEEFALASALIEVRANAGLTQKEVAQRMGTTLAVIACLESGRVNPSTRTLERFARVIGTQLRITFERDSQTLAMEG